MYQFSNICIRIQKFPTAKEICEFGEKHSSEYLNREFKEKIKTVEKRLK